MKARMNALVFLMFAIVYVCISILGVMIDAYHKEPAKLIDYDRQWKIEIIDDNVFNLISNGDTVAISVENTYNIGELNPIAFTNIN